jgi:hypothetical protein
MGDVGQHAQDVVDDVRGFLAGVEQVTAKRRVDRVSRSGRGRRRRRLGTRSGKRERGRGVLRGVEPAVAGGGRLRQSGPSPPK